MFTVSMEVSPAGGSYEASDSPMFTCMDLLYGSFIVSIEVSPTGGSWDASVSGIGVWSLTMIICLLSAALVVSSLLVIASSLVRHDTWRNATSKLIGPRDIFDCMWSKYSVPSLFWGPHSLDWTTDP